MPEDLAHFTEAAARIAPYVRRTPLLTARVDGRKVSLKLEHLQVAGVFKIRGALNALLVKREATASRHKADARVVTASGGNHGLGVATAAGSAFPRPSTSPSPSRTSRRPGSPRPAQTW
jgi:threonine dehydratase